MTKEHKPDYIDMEFFDGYMDGRDVETPSPTGNRSLAYHHSFAIGREEALGINPKESAEKRRRRAEAIRDDMSHGYSVYGAGQ